MALNAGDLNLEVVIQQLTTSTGPSHAPVESWTTLLTAWMGREAQTGSERFNAAQVSASATTTWFMRYVDSMDPDLVDVPTKRRLSYQGRIYGIVQAEHIDRKERIVLTTLAKSKVA
ncbi:MAG: phage head closure protein [Vicinamibacterales bacterium]